MQQMVALCSSRTSFLGVLETALLERSKPLADVPVKQLICSFLGAALHSAFPGQGQGQGSRKCESKYVHTR